MTCALFDSFGNLFITVVNQSNKIRIAYFFGIFKVWHCPLGCLSVLLVLSIPQESRFFLNEPHEKFNFSLYIYIINCFYNCISV